LRKTNCLIITVILLFIVNVACDNDDIDSAFDFPETIRALSEHDFLNDENAFAVPEDGVVLTHLEHPEAGHEADTGEQGMDIIPIKYISDTNHTYCWEDDNEDALHFMTLNDLEGNEILRVDVNGNCVTEFVKSGEYEIHVHHDGNSEEVLPIFIRPDNLAEEETAQVSQSVGLNLQTLISTNSCPGCDLQTARIGTSTMVVDAGIAPDSPGVPEVFTVSNDLSDANLQGANLTGADLSGGIYNGANFMYATLRNVSDGGADFQNANFTGAIWKNGNGCDNLSIGECNQGKFVFVTSMSVSSNILSAAQAMFSNCTTVSNGLDAADCICGEVANNVGIGSNYRAWLADDTGSPSTRFTQSSILYIRTDGANVANNWQDLTDGWISNTINIDQNRNVFETSSGQEAYAWTNVTISGTLTPRAPGGTPLGDQFSSCQNWTAVLPLLSNVRLGGTGDANFGGPSWTEGDAFECLGPDTDIGPFNILPKLYCFQQ